ncbi:MFS transporter [Caulobacter segnis]
MAVAGGVPGHAGHGRAAAIPAGMKSIGEWFPDRERSVAVGWFNAGTSLGAVIAPVLVALVAKTWGWQSAFFVTGLIGVVFAGAWFRFYRSPAKAGYVSPAERTEIQDGQRSVPASASTLKAIVVTPRFWAIAVPRFLAEPAWQTFSFWIPLYLAKERGMDLTHIALFAWMPFLARTQAASLAAIWRSFYKGGEA